MDSTVVLGNFDGVHLGHQALFAAGRELATQYHTTLLAYTFNPHPTQILAGAHPVELLQTFAQKREALKRFVDEVVAEPFTAAFAQMSAESFFTTILLTKLHARAIVVGYNFTFGKARSGTTQTLVELCQQHHVALRIVPAQFHGSTLVSSSLIRQLIKNGDVKEARRYLTRPYRLEGHVVRGRGLGGSLGAHTANLQSVNSIFPPDGVYLSQTSVFAEPCNARQLQVKDSPSISSVGWNPTFPNSPFSIETHLLNQESELLGKYIAIDFLERMRDQIKFETPDALKQQIAADLQEARKKHGLPT